MIQFLGSSCRVIILLVLSQAYLGAADCECGYRIPYTGNSSSQQTALLFTDAVQVNFRAMHDLSRSQDWKIKYVRFNYVPNSGRYGKRVEARNIVPNPLANVSAGWDSPSLQGVGVDAGLQLIVRSNLSEGNLVSTGQIQSRREDVRFGSFRTYMKTTPVNGTCASHFWYNSDSKEIDVELLSRQQEGGRNPANFVVHSNESVADGNDARNTAGYIEGKLRFDPADGFHEYRYDWSADVVSFYADGKWMGDVNQSIPTDPGYFQLSHWSDGNPGWTAGPPSQDAVLTVGYYMGFFNSTDGSRIQDFESKCGGGRDSVAVCDVPDFSATAKATQGPVFVGVAQNSTGERSFASSYRTEHPGLLNLALLFLSVFWVLGI